MSTTKDLGLVKSIHEGLTPPTNTVMLWFDTNTGVNKLKYYNTSTSAWTLLVLPGTVVYRGTQSSLTTAPASPVMGDLYVMTVAGALTWSGVTFSPNNVVSVGDFAICRDATNWDIIRGTTGSGGGTVSKYFQDSLTMVANTPLTITHGLGLSNKNSFVAKVYDSTGADINVNIIGVTINTLTITSDIGLSNVKITVIG